MAGQDPIQAARQRRVALHEAMIEFETAITAPSAAPTWVEQVGEGLSDVASALAKHIAEVDRGDGIIAKALDVAPWLESHAQILRDEHDQLTAHLQRLEHLFGRMESSDANAVAAMREESYDFLRHLSRHRQNGAELVYDAYDMDIGGRG